MLKMKLIGQRFGLLTVIGENPKSPSDQKLKWRCICDCGREVIRNSQKLRIVQRPSCDNCKVNLYVNRISQRFNRLLVQSYIGVVDHNHMWYCKCDCGNSRDLSYHDLKRGKTKECRDCAIASFSRKIRKEKIGDISSEFWTKQMWTARDRNIEFTISPEEAFQIFLTQNRKCALSGLDIVLDVSEGKRTDRTASLDRIDSSQGYHLPNIQWVHKHINFMKADMNETDFINWCKKIKRHKIS